MIFINQSTGRLFSEVIDQLCHLPGPHCLITGDMINTWTDVEVVRCCPLQKDTAAKRIFTWVWFTIQTFFYLSRIKRGEYLFIVTNPPMIIWLGPLFKLLKRCRYSLLIYDVYPDALILGGKIHSNTILAQLWRRMNAIALRGAENVITLSNDMTDTLRSQLCSRDKGIRISVIENWTDTDLFIPIPKDQNPFLMGLNLEDKFIVSYAGAFGATHCMDTIIQCAEILKNNSSIHFLLIGGGTEEKKIQRSLKGKRLTNITRLTFQPLVRFRYIAAAPDISLILLKEGGERVSMPSKVYTALAAGTAILAATSNSSSLAELINKNTCGIVIPPGDAKAMAEGVLYLSQHPEQVEKYKSNARKTAEAQYRKEVQCSKYRDLLSEKI